jgi:hypothetical protein
MLPASIPTWHNRRRRSIGLGHDGQISPDGSGQRPRFLAIPKAATASAPA